MTLTRRAFLQSTVAAPVALVMPIQSDQTDLIIENTDACGTSVLCPDAEITKVMWTGQMRVSNPLLQGALRV